MMPDKKQEMVELFARLHNTVKQALNDLVEGILEANGAPDQNVRALQLRAIHAALSFHVGAIEALLKLFGQGVEGLEEKLVKERETYFQHGLQTSQAYIKDEIKKTTN
jgi:hypothetical protein